MINLSSVFMPDQSHLRNQEKEKIGGFSSVNVGSTMVNDIRVVV